MERDLRVPENIVVTDEKSRIEYGKHLARLSTLDAAMDEMKKKRLERKIGRLLDRLREEGDTPIEWTEARDGWKALREEANRMFEKDRVTNHEGECFVVYELLPMLDEIASILLSRDLVSN